jgi:hypothetical protein
MLFVNAEFHLEKRHVTCVQMPVYMLHLPTYDHYVPHLNLHPTLKLEPI